jgi:hypothetical protein
VDIKQTLMKKIEKVGYKFNELSEREVEYLVRIEEVISEIFSREEKAKELLTNNHLSINSISQKSNIARQTIYNNNVLLEYIEHRSAEFKNIDLSTTSSELIEKIRMLQVQVDKMTGRDCEIEELKIEVNTLRNKLKDKEQELMRYYKTANIVSKN